MLSAFLCKISSKLRNLNTNFKDKSSLIIQTSKSKLKKSALEDENNGTQKKVKFQIMNTCLTLQSCKRTSTNPFSRVSKVSERKNAQEKNCQFQKKTLVRFEILSVFVW